jgi:hypothetical protein
MKSRCHCEKTSESSMCCHERASMEPTHCHKEVQRRVDTRVDVRHCDRVITKCRCMVSEGKEGSELNEKGMLCFKVMCDSGHEVDDKVLLFFFFFELEFIVLRQCL